MIDDPSEVIQPHASLIVVYTSGMLRDKEAGKKDGQQKISIDFFVFLSFKKMCFNIISLIAGLWVVIKQRLECLLANLAIGLAKIYLKSIQ